MENNFNSTPMSEEELDALEQALFAEIAADESKTTMLNMPRLQQMEFCHSVLQTIMKGEPVRISYKLYKPFKSMGSITVEGKCLDIHDMKWFSRICEFASNTEVYPIRGNSVRMTFTFHNLTTPIE